MKNKILKTALLASSLAILFWGGVTFTPPQDELEPTMPVSTEIEIPGGSGISTLSDFSSDAHDEDDIPSD